VEIDDEQRHDFSWKTMPLSRHSRESGNPGARGSSLPWAPAFAGVTNGAGGAVQTHNALDHAPSAPPGLRAGLVEIGDVAGGSHVAEPRSARHRERGDRGFVLGDLRHDRLLRAVEDAAVGGDEVLRVTQAGEIAVDFRHDVTGHQVAAAHRVFRVGPVVHETYEGTEAA